jgi:hypothetical protein
MVVEKRRLFGTIWLADRVLVQVAIEWWIVLLPVPVATYDENVEPEHRAQPPTRRNACGGMGGYSKKRKKEKPRFKKGAS